MRNGRRLERRDAWDAQALDAVARQLDELAAMLGHEPAAQTPAPR